MGSILARGFLVVFLASASAGPASALVQGVVDSNVATSPWAGVVSIQPSSGGTFSGAIQQQTLAVPERQVYLLMLIGAVVVFGVVHASAQPRAPFASR